MKNLIFDLLLIAIFIVGCAVTEETTKKVEEKSEVVEKIVNEVNLEIEKTFSWVNLMPGSTPKFHISGKITLLKGDNYENNSTKLKFIKVYQSGKELYFIMPKVIEELSGNVKKITYSTVKGLSINKELKTKKPVEFEFLFKDGKEELLYREDNIIVEEVH